MPTGNSWWRHIQCGYSVGRPGCSYVRVKNGDSILNSGQVIRLQAAPILRKFVQYLGAFCSRPETDNHVTFKGRFVRPIVQDKCVNFCYPRLISLWRKSPRSRWKQHFQQFYSDKFQPEAVNDVMSGWMSVRKIWWFWVKQVAVLFSSGPFYALLCSI